MERNIAWAAGLFDGEGCVTYQKGSFVILMSLEMTHETTVKWFRHCVGVGNWSIRPATAKHKATYTWSVSGSEAALVAAMLRPFSFTKQRQLDLAIEWGEKCDNPSRQEVPIEIMAHRQVIAEELAVLNLR